MQRPSLFENIGKKKEQSYALSKARLKKDGIDKNGCRGITSKLIIYPNDPRGTVYQTMAKTPWHAYKFSSANFTCDTMLAYVLSTIFKQWNQRAKQFGSQMRPREFAGPHLRSKLFAEVKIRS